MGRILLWLTVGFVLLAAAVYAGDWLMWRVRGASMGSVEVSRVTVATLKGNKENYYFDGTDLMPCPNSLLPQPAGGAWLAPCWWRRRHPNVETRD